MCLTLSALLLLCFSITYSKLQFLYLPIPTGLMMRLRCDRCLFCLFVFLSFCLVLSCLVLSCLCPLLFWLQTEAEAEVEAKVESKAKVEAESCGAGVGAGAEKKRKKSC